jgi:hypothetical protein
MSLMMKHPDGDAHRKAIKALGAKVRAAYPEAEYIGGVGWCGPDWQAAQAMWNAGREALGL